MWGGDSADEGAEALTEEKRNRGILSACSSNEDGQKNTSGEECNLPRGSLQDRDKGANEEVPR